MNNCIDCKKELKSLKAKRCTPCENKRRFKLEIMNHKGEHHPRFKGGLPHCIDCDKKLSNYNVKRCRKCAGIQHGLKTQGQNHYGYIDGRTNKKYFCIDCKKEIRNIYAKRCPECLIKFNIGENNPNWKGGRSFEPYSHEFNKELKEQIRKRDNYICQNCSMTEEEHLIVVGKELSVHHIDYNKENCNKNNLITTCLWCNSRANHNRNYWHNYYQEKMGAIKCVSEIEDK